MHTFEIFRIGFNRETGKNELTLLRKFTSSICSNAQQIFDDFIEEMVCNPLEKEGTLFYLSDDKIKSGRNEIIEEYVARHGHVPTHIELELIWNMNYGKYSGAGYYCLNFDYNKYSDDSILLPVFKRNNGIAAIIEEHTYFLTTSNCSPQDKHWHFSHEQKQFSNRPN